MRSSRPRDVPARERYALTAVFGGIVVTAFAYQAVAVAESLGWIAYPLVATIAVASFLVSRIAWRCLTGVMQAHLRRQRHLEDSRANQEG